MKWYHLVLHGAEKLRWNDEILTQRSQSFKQENEYANDCPQHWEKYCGATHALEAQFMRSS